MESIIDYVIDSFNGIQLCFVGYPLHVVLCPDPPKFQFVIRGSLSVLIEFTNLVSPIYYHRQTG